MQRGLASTHLPVAWIAERALVVRWAPVPLLEAAEPENHKCVMEAS